MAIQIYSTGYIPEEMRESEFIVIPKKVGAMDCNRHRTISIMSKLSRIILKIVNERLKKLWKKLWTTFSSDSGRV